MDAAPELDDADYEQVGHYADEYEGSAGTEHAGYAEHLHYHHGGHGYHHPSYQHLPPPTPSKPVATSPSPLQRQHSQPYTTLQYPAAEASHEQVLDDSGVFFDTLRRLHDTLGTKFRVPVVAGQDLDLHLLYRQVTSFGGLEAVINNKKWSDVAQPFNFPASFTSRSFTMRKIYSQFLHHYEQVYFHRNTGPLAAAPGSLNPEILAQVPMKRRAELVQSGQGYSPPPQTPALVAVSQNFPPPPHNPNLVGSQLVGTVDAKFDCGYFVTIQAGGHNYRGILYSPPPYVIPSQPPPIQAADSSQDLNTAKYSDKKYKPTKDPNKPKQNKTPFNYFSIDARARAKELHPDADQKEISKIVGEMWASAAPDEKQPYIDQARRDRERYERELAEYHRAMHGIPSDDRGDKDSDMQDQGQHQSLSSVPSPQDPYSHHHHQHHLTEQHTLSEHTLSEQLYSELPHRQHSHPRALQVMPELSGVQHDMYQTAVQHGLIDPQHSALMEHLAPAGRSDQQVYQWNTPSMHGNNMELPYTLPLHVGDQPHYTLSYGGSSYQLPVQALQDPSPLDLGKVCSSSGGSADAIVEVFPIKRENQGDAIGHNVE